MLPRRHQRELRPQRVHRGVRFDLGGIEVELLAVDQPGLQAQLHDPFEEALEGLHAIAAADLGEAAVVGERLVEVVAQVPTMSEVELRRLHQPALGGDPLEEGDQLELEEDHRVDGGPSEFAVAVSH